jgi:hypothetical protein
MNDEHVARVTTYESHTLFFYMASLKTERFIHRRAKKIGIRKVRIKEQSLFTTTRVIGVNKRWWIDVRQHPRGLVSTYVNSRRERTTTASAFEMVIDDEVCVYVGGWVGGG